MTPEQNINTVEEIQMPLYFEKRRCGNTIRIVDYLIQKLFRYGECYCWDHYRDPHNPRINYEMKKYVMKMVLKRLEFEHTLNEDNFLEIDRKNFTIKLKNK